MITRQTKRTILSGWTLVLAILYGSIGYAVPPYGDPNQPYDQLPGTLESYHIKWAKPLSGGKLKVLFIIPYGNSREVVEAAQRLEMDYTVIMNSNNSSWDKGFNYHNATRTLLGETEGETVLKDISRQRLSLGHSYDAIVIAKVSWAVMPSFVRELILQHVKRGAGLVYISPNRLKFGLRAQAEVNTPDAQFTDLFETNAAPEAGDWIFEGLPMDTMPLHRLTQLDDYKTLKQVNRSAWGQSPICIYGARHEKGHILSLEYFDASEYQSFDTGNSLTPYIGDYSSQSASSQSATDKCIDVVMYDYTMALLTKCILWAANREPGLSARIDFAAPPTELKTVVDEELAKRCWEYKTPANVIDRKDIKDSKVIFSVSGPGKNQEVKLRYSIRNRDGETIMEETFPGVVKGEKSLAKEIGLPFLSRGTYFVDLRILDLTDKVISFSSKGFRVETVQQVKEIKTDKVSYQDGEKITVSFTLTNPLETNEEVEVWAEDTWGRKTAIGAGTIGKGETQGTFTLPAHLPLSRMWDIYCGINDNLGMVDFNKTWVGLPTWKFDDFMGMLSFSPTPHGSWNLKGHLYGKEVRKYGINSAYTYMIYDNIKQYESNERYHLASVTYAEHAGQENIHTPKINHDEEFSDRCLSELSRMFRYVADTGNLLDPNEFPYDGFGAHAYNAEFINKRIQQYIFSGRFGSPLYVLTGENYLCGEGQMPDSGALGIENSCFCPLCTKKFQDWCRKQYNNDLTALNAEWGSNLKSWDDARGILLKEAVDKNQLPRWVDFRYFMRSEVWSQCFIDWSDMMTRFIPEAQTGRVGHSHHDFTKYRDQMTSSKLYMGSGDENPEWNELMTAELLQSFSRKPSFLLASESMTFWTHNLQTPLNNERWPWKVLFLGLNGFDWERGFPVDFGMGGESCLTLDMSRPLPFFKNISNELLFIQQGIGKLTLASKPYRSKVAMLWAPYNHYISRLYPFQERGFTGGPCYNIEVTGGAPSDCLALMNSIRMRPTIVAPEDIYEQGLEKRGFKVLLLPYNKGMSIAEAKAIKDFARKGGLVIADNTPGIYSEHGRELKESRLKELFPVMNKSTITPYGKGYAAYLPMGFNRYVVRFAKRDYTGTDTVASLIKKYAGETPPVEILDARGIPRRDTFMPVFHKGSTTLLGLLRVSSSEGNNPEDTTVVLKKSCHIWDIRKKSYLGYKDKFKLRLDLHPYFYALLPVCPEKMSITSEKNKIKPGEDAIITGKVDFSSGNRSDIDALAQAAQVRVYGPDKQEQEWFRQNIVFEGSEFKVILPISYSAKGGRYTVEVEHALTGMKANAFFDVEELKKKSLEAALPRERPLKVMCARYTPTPPIIDGKLDDKCWEGTEIHSDFVNPATGDPLKRQTTMRALYDQNNIYIGLEVFWSDMEILKKGIKEISGKDCFVNQYGAEVFIDPRASGENYYHILYNAGGQFRGQFKFKMGELKKGVKCRDIVQTDRWSSEVMFPAEGVKTGDEWGINVCRNDEAPYGIWKVVGYYNHNPSMFGRLVLGDYKEWWQTVWSGKAKIKLKEIGMKKQEPDLESLFNLVQEKAMVLEELSRQYPPENRANFEILYETFSEFCKDFNRLNSLYNILN